MHTLVLVHGAWHGGWCWETVAPLLDHAGVSHAEVELPFTGHDGDVEATVAVLDSIEGSKVLVGHSYGGLVISGAGEGRHDLAHLVYLCAFLVQPGETVFDELGRVADLPAGKLLDAIVRHDDGTSTINPEMAGDAFYSQTPPDAARRATARLRPMDGGSTLAKCRGAPWRNVPSTYVLCEQDQAIPVEGQRRMARTTSNSVVFDADHSPFLSVPEQTARLLIELATAAR